MTVLIIDDEDDIRLIADVALRASGLAVVCASGGLEGLTLAKQQAPDLIVLDVMMPEMDGYATLDRLHDDPATSAIPVVLLTAKELDDRDAGLAARGVVGCIPKPFRPREFVERVRAILQSRT